MKTKVKQNQNLLDLAVQHGGDISTAFDLARKNNIEVDEWVQPGSEIDTPEVINEDVKTVFSKSNSPASSTIAPGEVVTPAISIPDNFNEYNRNPHWIDLPSIERSENKVLILFAVFENYYNPFVVSSNYPISVDLGNSDTFNYGEIYNYQYNEVESIILQDRYGENYKQVVITIENLGAYSPVASVWNLYLDRIPTTPSTGSNGSVNYLDIRIACDFELYPILSSRLTANYLEIVKIDSPNISNFYMLYTTNIRFFDIASTSFSGTSYSSTFYQTSIDFTSISFPNATSLSTVFRGCKNLFELEIYCPLAQYITNLFLECRNLRSLKFADCSSITTTTNFVNGCVSLQELRMPNISVSLSVKNTFLNRDNLILLFNDLADLSLYPSQSIDVSGTPNVDDLTPSDLLIATSKNWNIITY